MDTDPALVRVEKHHLGNSPVLRFEPALNNARDRGSELG